VKTEKNDDGIEFIGFLLFAITVILLIIKIEWYIDISWTFVFAPLWITVLLVFMVSIYFEIMSTFKKKKE
jgi:hypothetical protein